ncbi:aspartate aminotransferase family protein [Brevibacillus composti]|uniref:glutamate-1-semialdehyde 2,1-aminomutase n=1 Tax=Brevibacillus composti TaxID=2796470 RepID=A0A7T5EMI5_9BACL|nr:aspartate aminotransferase family protein [Brevibacillus composti]QQE75322.1 aspartate aminotransferase family protein [Brevibacillus composti]QUO42348.1 aspartate aminotransferase family protein [Brevibacillus composti]
MLLQTVFQEAEEAYRKRTERSREAHAAAQKVMPGGDTRTIAFFKPYPLTVSRGSGPRIYDADGCEYLDFLNNYTAMIHGHAHPFILEKVQAAITLGTGYAAAIAEQRELAEILCGRIPGMDQVRFCNSGTEATMFALRAARAYTGRPAVIKMEGGYHGTHDAVEFSIAPGAERDSRQPGWTPIPDTKGVPESVARDVYVAPFNDPAAVEEILRQKGEEVAAILVEPVMGVAGVIPPLPGYLAELRRLADQYGVLLVFDEVQTLRLDLGGAQRKFGVTPDLTAIGKIIGGGFPVGAFGGRAEIMAQFDPNQSGCLSQSGTFNGNRATMAAGIASMTLLDERAIARLDLLGERLEAGMRAAIGRYAVPASVNRIGSMLNLHFTERPPVDYASTHSPYKELSKLVHLELLNRGVFTAPRGMWNLSTVMEETDIDQAVDAFADVMAKVSRHL